MLSQQPRAAMPTPSIVSANLAGWSTLERAKAEICADVPYTWQAAALTANALEAGGDGAYVRSELAIRVQALTGRMILDSPIAADGAARWVTAVVDGVAFQLQGHDLRLLRPCAHCGTGHFTSSSLVSRADLGYALSGWQPYHAGCEPADPAADADW
jgi:hypothetical protein